MSKKIISIGDTGAKIIETLSDNFTELYHLSDELYHIFTGSGVDDTQSFQALIDQAQVDYKKILIYGNIILTDEIQITKSVYIKGIDAYNPDTKKINSNITFSNTSVSGEIATKCCFRITCPGSVNYKQGRINIKNIEFTATNITAKHQHAIIIDGYSTLSNSTFDNLVFKRFSGYCFYFNGASNGYPYGHLLSFTNIGAEWVGGIFGNSRAHDSYFAACKIENVYLEAGLSPVSCENICFDLIGFRETNIKQIIAEGNFDALPLNSTLFFLNYDAKLDVIWEEGLPGGYDYIIEATGGMITLNNYLLEIGGNNQRKIKASGEFTLIDITNSGLADENTFSDIFTIADGARIKLENITRWGSGSSGATAKYPLIQDSQIGVFTLKNVLCRYGNTESAYLSQNKYIEIFRKGDGYLKNNGFVTFNTIPLSITHSTERQELIIDNEEGRVVEWKTDSLCIPTGLEGYIIIEAPQYAGSTLIIGIRYKYSTEGADCIINLISTAYLVNAEKNMTFGNSVLNEWSEQYVVINNYSGYVNLSAVFYDVLSKVNIYISEMVISFGSELPQMKSSKGIININITASEVPSYGNFVKGDYIKNTEPIINGETNNKYIIDGWKRITTGGNNIINVDWVECRNLIGI